MLFNFNVDKKGYLELKTQVKCCQRQACVLFSFISCGQNLENDLSVGQHCIFQLNFQHICTWYVTKLFTWIPMHKIGSLRTNCKCSLFRTGASAALFSRKTVSVLDSSLGRCFGRLFLNKLNVTAGSGYFCHKQIWLGHLSQTHYNKNPSSESSGDTV